LSAGARDLRATRDGGAAGLALILLLHGALGVVDLGGVPRFFDDEAWEASLAWSLAHEGTLRNSSMTGCGGMDVHFVQPRITLAIACSSLYALGGTGITTCRLASLGVTTLGLLGTALLARRWFGTATALGAALALALHPWFFEVSRRIRPEAYVLGFSALGLWLLVMAVENRRRGALAGACLTFAGLAHPIGWLAVGAAGGGALAASGPAAVLRRVPALALGATAVLLPYALYVAIALRDPEVNFLRQLEACGALFTATAGFYWEGLAEAWRFFFQWPLGAPLAAVTAAAFAAAWRGGARGDRAVAFALGVFLVAAPYGKAQVGRYLFATTPLMALLIARLIERLLRGDAALFRGRPLLARVLAGGVIAAYAATSIVAIGVLFWRVGGSDFDALLERIGRTVGRESLVYGDMLFWLGHEHYRFEPLHKERVVEDVSEELREAGVDYVVRTAWEFPSSHAVSMPPLEMPPFRMTSVDRAATQHGILVESFRDPYYGPVEIYRMEWSQR